MAALRLVRAGGLLATAGVIALSVATSTPPPTSPLAFCRAGCAGPLMLASLTEGNLGAWHLGVDVAILVAATGLAVHAALVRGASAAWSAAGVLAAQAGVGTLLPTILLFTWERGLRADYSDAVAGARARARRCGA